VADWIICTSRLPQGMRSQGETTNKLQMTACSTKYYNTSMYCLVQ
jgi:hypothetical protein